MSRLDIKNDQLAIFGLQLIHTHLEQQNLTPNSFGRKPVIENSNTTSDNIHNGIYSDGKRTALACALYFGIAPDDVKPLVVEQLVKAVRERNHTAGFGILGSSFFTALGNGAVSAIISFLRSLVFQVVAVLVLPLLLDIDGIWLAVSTAELLSMVVLAAFLIGLRKKYRCL